MPIPFDLVERYGATALNFMLQRPREFLARRESNPEASIPPYQFLLITLGIMFSLLLARFTLTLSGLRRATGEESFDDPKAVATRLLVFVVLSMFANTFLTAWLSRLWPVRKRPSIQSIFNFYCYYLILLVPLAALDVIVQPLLDELAAEKVIAEWISFVPTGIGFIIGTMIFAFYLVPGMAHINEVSNGKMWVVLFVWPFLASALLSCMAGFVIGFWMSFWPVFWDSYHRASGG